MKKKNKKFWCMKLHCTALQGREMGENILLFPFKETVVGRLGSRVNGNQALGRRDAVEKWERTWRSGRWRPRTWPWFRGPLPPEIFLNVNFARTELKNEHKVAFLPISPTNSINQSINGWNNRTINQWMEKSNNQSIEQSTTYLWHNVLQNLIPIPRLQLRVDIIHQP